MPDSSTKWFDDSRIRRTQRRQRLMKLILALVLTALAAVLFIQRG